MVTFVQAAFVLTTFVHIRRQHLSWLHLSISGISQPLLTQFWLHFKSRFLGSFKTDSNCQGDICPGNLCSGHICPYMRNISAVTDLILTKLKGRFMGPSLDANRHSHICPGNICPGNISPYQQYISTYWHNQNFWTTFFGGLNFCEPAFFLDKTSFDQNNIWIKQSFYLNVFEPDFFTLNLLDRKSLGGQHFLYIKTFWAFIFLNKMLFGPTFFDPIFFFF